MAVASDKQRRNLNFDSINDVIDDVNRIAAADAGGDISVTGSWSVGEILTHLSAWIEYAYDGYPIDAPPWIIKQVLKFHLRSILKHGMKPGIDIPGVEGGTVGQEKVDCDVACRRYLVALNRLASSEGAKYPSPAFGRLDKNKLVKLNLRHAELHLSFIQIDA